MQRTSAKRKTAAELKREALLRKKSAKKSGHAKRSKAAKKGAKSLSSSERTKRAVKAWKTRRKLYGDAGTTVKASTDVLMKSKKKVAHLTPEGKALALRKAKEHAKRISDKKASDKASKKAEKRYRRNPKPIRQKD